MQVDSTAILLVVRTGGKQDSKDSYYDHLRDRLVVSHMTLVEVLYGMHSSQIEARSLLCFAIQEHIHVLLEVQIVFVLADVFALVRWTCFGIGHGRPSLAPKKKSHVNVEDD